MKRAIYLAAAAVACLSLSACATGPATATVSLTIDAATADAAAVKFEVAVGVFADTLAFAASDPDSGLDLNKLAAGVVDGRTYLVKGRAAFDGRTGDVSAAATQALDAVSLGLSATASPKVRGALLAARLAVGLYGATVGVTGSPVEPSATLVQARKSADAAIKRLIDFLPPAGGT